MVNCKLQIVNHCHHHPVTTNITTGQYQIIPSSKILELGIMKKSNNTPIFCRMSECQNVIVEYFEIINAINTTKEKLLLKNSR